jgi:hypothetical protein
MLRSSIETAFVFDSEILRGVLPVHRAGAAFFIYNASSAQRTVFMDQDDGAGGWVQLTLNGTVTLPPYGIGVGYFTVDGDPERLRVRLDARADQDGVFVQLMSPAPRPQHPLP